MEALNSINMKVEEEIDHPYLSYHKIQFGVSTWSENETNDNQSQSIRRAVYNSDGIFSPHGSSEIPIDDMALLMRECIRRRKISKWTLIKMLFIVTKPYLCYGK